MGANLNDPEKLAVDESGNLLIADVNNNRIRQISVDGIITTVAGNGSAGYSGDGGPATSAEFGSLLGIAVDGTGDILVADYYNNRVREISTNGIVTTVAGTGTPGFSGDGASAMGAQLSQPRGVTADGADNLYIADSANNRIRKVSPNGIINSVVGGGTSYLVGGLATNAHLDFPSGVAIDGAGNLYISNAGDVWSISANGIVASSWSEAGSPAGIALDLSGRILVANANDNYSDVVQFLPTDGSAIPVVGIPHTLGGFYGDGGPATSAAVYDPEGMPQTAQAIFTLRIRTTIVYGRSPRAGSLRPLRVAAPTTGLAVRVPTRVTVGRRRVPNCTTPQA